MRERVKEALEHGSGTARRGVGVLPLTCGGVVCVLAAIAGCDPPVGRELAADMAFIDITETAFDTELPVVGWPGLALFDYDNDSDIDILVTNIANLPNLLYRNDGDGIFTEVADEAPPRASSAFGAQCRVQIAKLQVDDRRQSEKEADGDGSGECGRDHSRIDGDLGAAWQALDSQDRDERQPPAADEQAEE